MKCSSRGVTKRIEAETTSLAQYKNESQQSKRKILGGYDGGVEVGYNGTWNERRFKDLLDQLEIARTAAENEKSDDRFVTLEDMTFAVQAHGGNCGAHYKYIIEGGGIKVYIHANPQGPIQPVRIRYGFESLNGRDLFAVHANTLEWLQKLGFRIEKETISRADLQTMVFHQVAEFAALFLSNHVVRRARKHKLEGSSRHPITSITLGSIKSVQLQIYDKRQELLDTRDEVKLQMLMQECLGGEFPDELTRIEFRLGRAALKCFGINTMQDLLEKERALVEYLTHDWFRIFQGEKQKGNETRQAIHPLWQEVQELFFEYFPGSCIERKPIEHKSRRRELKCTGKDLVQQAVGCLATAAAVVKGMFEDEKSALNYVYEVLSDNVKRLFIRTSERVKELGIVRGVEAPNAMDWHLDPRFACASSVMMCCKNFALCTVKAKSMKTSGTNVSAMMPSPGVRSSAGFGLRASGFGKKIADERYFCNRKK